MSRLLNNHSTETFRRDLRKNQSDAEKKLWSRLRNRQVENIKFYRQFSIGPYIIDFYCPSRRLAVEPDGGQHAGTTQIAHDKKRTAYLADHGVTVIRFWNNDVLQNRDGVLERIVEVCRSPNSL